jgi:hypothetical protein
MSRHIVRHARDFETQPHRLASKRNAGGRELSVSRLVRCSGRFRRREQIVPYIRMSGKWLQRLGFSFGSRIHVTEELGRVTLTIVADERQDLIN